MPRFISDSELTRFVRAALREDVGSGDVTTMLTVPAGARGTAMIVARGAVTLSGMALAKRAFLEIDPEIKLSGAREDGSRLEKGQSALEISGGSRGILTAERVALNFLGHLSGIATLTARFAALAAAGAEKARLTNNGGPLVPRILDTRKTLPGLRLLEKKAVAHGGGRNHRFGLSDGILIKDNHIKAAGSVQAALRSAKEGAPHNLRIEIEVDSLDQLREALPLGPDMFLLDNMDPGTLTEAMDIIAAFHAPGPRLTLAEASGGINLDNVALVAASGVDFISVGAITHSAPAADLGLDWC